MKEKPNPEPPIHPWGRCEISAMKTIAAGTATIDGLAGADWTIMYNNDLPDYYISDEDAKKSGWKKGKWPSNFVSGKMIFNGIYNNSNNHLPESPGRVLILTTEQVREIHKELFGQTTDWCSLPMTITKHFMK